MAELTPMKRQYLEIKQANPDCLLFFRLGDFYEMFDEDAILVSRELELTLTTRDRGKPEEERTPMCGVPYHSCEPYIARLIEKGYKVAICEQLEDPAEATGLVQRGITRIITPGTVTDASMLEDGRANYLGALWLEGESGAAAFCDVSTGELCSAEYTAGAAGHLMNELARFGPREVLLSPGAAANAALTGQLRRIGCMTQEASAFFAAAGDGGELSRRFGTALSRAEALTVGALFAYLNETQRRDLSHITRLDRLNEDRCMELDLATRRSLELTENLRTGKKKGSLLGVLDHTRTPMGGRLLRAWMERPLLNPVAIGRRLTAVDELYRDSIRRAELLEGLSPVGDITRLAARCVYGTANGRDLLALGRCLAAIPTLTETLAGVQSAMLRAVAETDPLAPLCDEIRRTVCDDPPFSVREGGIIRSGFDEELDRLRDIRDNGADAVAALEQRERERTGIHKLKVGFNRVFGYYIDIPRSAGDVPLPEDYVRKQTLVSNERYITSELKELENTLLTARDRIAEREYALFSALREHAAAEVARLQAAADRVAELDTLCSLAEAAFRNGYTAPQVDLSRTIDIRDGRHPVVESTQKDVLFVPNDTFLNDGDERALIVTGPNMAGKSTYMRQTALIVLMAQMGSFVPAKSAVIGVTDRVFTRIGASDDLTSGQSTFMVEMSEMAGILRNATAASLLILDEIGRGTSTYDGMAIARAMLEFCADKKRLGARTMFATHYHELAALEGAVPGIRCCSISARKQADRLIFLRKILPGAADDSYGIEVAKLAGVPDGVIRRAQGYLRELEAGGSAIHAVASPTADYAAPQLSMDDTVGQEVLQALRALSPDTLSPIEALNVLYQLKKKAGD